MKFNFATGVFYNPYLNLSLEKYMLDNVNKNEHIFFVWQNDPTVVIGRNQNAEGECNLAAMESDGVFLARRYTGGGAVFHDRGNLNFSFICHKDDENIRGNLYFIIDACKQFGIEAEATGRNDITVDGRKISGNAFLRTKTGFLHHGTIMINVDSAALGKYLTPSKEKLRSKGVASVKSRTVNLSSLNPAITADSMAKALSDAWKERCSGKDCTIIDLNQLSKTAGVEEIYRHLSSKEWLMGRATAFTHRFKTRFSWGDFDLNLAVDDGVISVCRIYSDSLDPDYIDALEKCFEGCEATKDAIVSKLQAGDVADFVTTLGFN